MRRGSFPGWSIRRRVLLLSVVCELDGGKEVERFGLYSFWYVMLASLNGTLPSCSLWRSYLLPYILMSRTSCLALQLLSLGRVVSPSCHPSATTSQRAPLQSSLSFCDHTNIPWPDRNTMKNKVLTRSFTIHHDVQSLDRPRSDRNLRLVDLSSTTRLPRGIDGYRQHGMCNNTMKAARSN